MKYYNLIVVVGLSWRSFLVVSVDHAALECAGVVDGAAGVLGHRGEVEQTGHLDWRAEVATALFDLPSRIHRNGHLCALSIRVEVLEASVDAALVASVSESSCFL